MKNLTCFLMLLALSAPLHAKKKAKEPPKPTALDQYGATLGSWFGVSDSDLLQIFPNLANFTKTDVGLMGYSCEPVLNTFKISVDRRAL